MPFTMLKGTFKPAAGFPDGDSIRFAPHDPSPLFALPRQGRAAKGKSKKRDGSDAF